MVVWTVFLSTMELSPHSLTHQIILESIRSLFGCHPRRSKRPSSALPLLSFNYQLYQNIFRREPAITQFDWNFSAIHSSSRIFATIMSSDLPTAFRRGSSWPWIDHRVSGLVGATKKHFNARFHYGSTF